MSLNIIYDTPDFVVVNKPSGLTVHKISSTDTRLTLVDELLAKFPEIARTGEDPLRPGLVHRLDKDTSGLMIVAKTPTAFSYFKQAFQKRLIRKTYLALVYGQVKDQSGTINLPLGKLGTKQTTAFKGKKELRVRDAITNYLVLQRFSRYTLLAVSPLTGRTHQIRLHLKALGHPIVCDPLYGGKKQICPPILGRLFLHAQKLEFTAPTGEHLVLEADPPPTLTNFLNSSIIAS